LEIWREGKALDMFTWQSRGGSERRGRRYARISSMLAHCRSPLDPCRVEGDMGRKFCCLNRRGWGWWLLSLHGSTLSPSSRSSSSNQSCSHACPAPFDFSFATDLQIGQHVALGSAILSRDCFRCTTHPFASCDATLSLPNFPAATNLA
jgi:hypothetical protein